MFKVELTDDVAVLTATTRIEGRHRVAAREQVDELLASGVRTLLLDLSLLDRIDSSGLASVLVAYRLAKGADGELCLCGLNERVQAVFELTMLHEVIPIFSDRATALATMKGV